MYLAFFLQHYRQAWDVFKKTSVDIGVAGDENGRPVELPTEDKDSERLSFLKRNGVDADWILETSLKINIPLSLSLSLSVPPLSLSL